MNETKAVPVYILLDLPLQLRNIRGAVSDASCLLSSSSESCNTNIGRLTPPPTPTGAATYR